MFLDRDRYLYRKRQLVEVICQLRFPTILSISAREPADFQEAIRRDFPQYKRLQEQPQPTLAGGPGNFRVEEGERVINYQFLSADGKWLRHITHDDKAMLEAAVEGLEVEPDFYYMAREKFKNPWIVFCYLIFFVVVWMHMRHAFPSAFQTLGLNNYKYSGIIEVLGQIYAWMVCLMFAAVVILVFLGL